ncbi:hypothetical protein ACFQ5D_17170 [Paenibacillus farraposensis]|uniref:Uncharacterized protein n=1 Tax=Paenibacillus farraposensis TaxID=2807095 RepID=A0ABW4DGY8_9BACL|nr:hypothetical protein [Paenibacillus farraposensis]MCC3378431.1 hypothetical protein [Paenibacillus farraposensis]
MCGHVHKPTAKCGIIIALEGEFVFDGVERYMMKPGLILIGGAGRWLEVISGADGFQYCLAHYLPSGACKEKGLRWPEDVFCMEVTLNPE